MQKKEYISMHMLLYEVADWVEDTGVDIEYQPYESLDIQPQSVHKKKGAHREAVDELLNCVVESLQDEHPQREMIEA